jgi:ferredoxin--NADP+ reductase
VGDQVSVADLQKFYNALIFTVGAQSDRHLGIPGEDLQGSHPATDFVAWYNGHPDYRHLKFDLSAERVAVVGVGNVAVDVARILCSTPEELATTDIADYALEALRNSKVKEVLMLGRRGPVQAAFTNPELKELGELEGADFKVIPAEIEVDAFSQAALDKEPDKAVTKRLEMLKATAAKEDFSKASLLTLRFLVSPVELKGEGGKVSAMRMVRNRLNEKLQAESTGEEEVIPLGLVFRSVGYKGVPIAGLPFDEKKGTIPNLEGRIHNGSGEHLKGLYAAGWIKRGPSGVIGTNKPCAKESATAALADGREGKLPAVQEHDNDAFLKSKGVRAVGYPEWKILDRVEKELGQSQGRPRVKVTSVEEMLTAMDGAPV